MATLTAQFVSIPEEGATYTITITSASIPADGTLTLSKDPLHIVMPQPDDKYPGVRTLEAEINVLTKEPLAYLYSDDPLNTSVTIKRNNVTIFDGFLEPSQWQQPMVPGEWNEVQIVAMDALAALKNVPFYDRILLRGAPDEYGTSSLIGMLQQYCGSDITVRYQTGIEGVPITEGLLDGYFSSEAFIGTDVEDTTAHTFVGDMISDYARAMAITLIMLGKTLYVYRTDNEHTIGSDISEFLNDTNLDMQVVPPIREVTGDWDEEPEPEEPEGSVSSYLSYNYDTDPRVVATAYKGNWEAYGWPESFTAFGDTKPVLFSTATNRAAGSTPELYPGVGAREVADKVHIRVPYQARQWSVKCMTHMNRYRGLNAYAVSRMAVLPDDYTENTWDESSNYLRSTIALVVGDTLYDPYMVRSYGYQSDDDIHEQKWAEYVFRFQNVSDEEIVRAGGKVCIVVRSTYPDNTRQLTPHFAKDFSMFWELTRGDKRTVKVNDSIILESKDINTKLTSIGGQLGSVGFKAYNTHRTIYAMDLLANQYRVAHIQYTGNFVASDVMTDFHRSVTSHYVFLGKPHTLMSFDWNCRYNDVELTLLEDYA